MSIEILPQAKTKGLFIKPFFCCIIYTGDKMKILTIKQPYAQLIGEGLKKYEIRSRKTNYRGELYIHSSLSKTKTNSKESKLPIYLENKDLYYGHILFKCRLFDCIYIDLEFLNVMQKNALKNLYDKDCIGYYAWVISDVVFLNKKIRAKGNLGIWNYYDEEEVMNRMEDISYGWMDKYGNINNEVDESFSDNYILQSPKEIIDSKVGVCWDQVELERYLFKKNMEELKTYFICNYDGNKCPTHTFLTYKKDNNYYWFEHSWSKYKGIHKFNSIKDLLMDVNSKFIESEAGNEYNEKNILIREYSKPNPGLNVQEFYKHCEKEKVIELQMVKC